MSVQLNRTLFSLNLTCLEKYLYTQTKPQQYLRVTFILKKLGCFKTKTGFVHKRNSTRIQGVTCLFKRAKESRYILTFPTSDLWGLESSLSELYILWSNFLLWFPIKENSCYQFLWETSVLYTFLWNHRGTIKAVMKLTRQAGIYFKERPIKCLWRYRLLETVPRVLILAQIKFTCIN